MNLPKVDPDFLGDTCQNVIQNVVYSDEQLTQ